MVGRFLLAFGDEVGEETKESGHAVSTASVSSALGVAEKSNLGLAGKSFCGDAIST